MLFYEDWKFWSFAIALINTIGIVGVGIFNKLLHDKLVGNDLKHLDKKVDDISKEQSCMKTKLISVAEDVSYLKGLQDAKDLK